MTLIHPCSTAQWLSAVALCACAGCDAKSGVVADSGVTIDGAASDAASDSTSSSGDAPHDSAAGDAGDAGPDAPIVVDATPLPNGPWIVFSSNRSGNFDLYVAHPDGTGVMPIASDTGNDFFGTWSRDGQRIAYASNVSGSYQLYVFDIITGLTTPLSSARALATTPCYSPDDAQLAFGGDGPGGSLLYRVDSLGGASIALTTGTARDSSPAWSPDGKAIYFASDRAAGAFEVWSVAPDGSGLTQVTTGAGLIGGPAISHDATTLAFAQPSATDPTSTQVVLYSLASKAMTVLTAQGDSEPAFASKAEWVAVTSTRYDPANPEIVLVDPVGVRAPFRLTNSPGVDGQASFQPTP
ncbi:MAG: TolB family protein [Polyangiales bacterium]